MLLTFAFLGWSFYVLSGGSEYEPVANSIQARAASGIDTVAEVQVATLDPVESAETDAPEVSRAATLSDLAANSESGDDRFQITLASTSGSDAVMPALTSAEPEVISASYDTPVEDAAQPSQDALNAAVADALSGDVARASSDTSTWSENGVLQTEVFSLETYSQAVDSGIVMASSNAVLASESTDHREVTGNVVNMRAGPGTEFQAVGKLSKGTKIAVLDEPGNGWIMLEVIETGETGWMADWLLTASN
ncbi:SH3 domain-containing protein [Roseovarius sp. 2305UL8-3]|uniref:SH3 domain-containing protein n=1 Tax=Roseovarius conchicola TaxID=3121636 RepID=UPI0035270EDA